MMSPFKAEETFFCHTPYHIMARQPHNISMLRWMVELGMVDIITEVSIMASQMDMPREWHLETVIQVF